MKRRLMMLVLAAGLLLAMLVQARPVAAYAVPASREAALAEFQRQLEADGKPAGTYRVEISYQTNGRTVTETVYMTVTDAYTIVTGNIAVDAHDFEVSESQVLSMDSAAWIAAAGAHAWRTDTLAPLGVQADTNQVARVPGTYPVTFVTDNGVQTTIHVRVVEDVAGASSVTSEDIHTIYINNSTTQIQENVVTDTTFLWGAFGTWIDTVFSGLIVIAFLTPIMILLVEYSVILRVTRQLVQLLKRK